MMVIPQQPAQVGLSEQQVVWPFQEYWAEQLGKHSPLPLVANSQLLQEEANPSGNASVGNSSQSFKNSRCNPFFHPSPEISDADSINLPGELGLK